MPFRGDASRVISDITFANLYLFRAAHQYALRPGALPCVEGVAYDGSRHLIPLFEIDEIPVAQLERTLAGFDCFFPLAADSVTGLDGAVFDVTSQRDDSDYLYPAANFLDYAGRTLGHKRSLVRQLLHAHAMTAEPYSPQRHADALAVLGGWMRDKGNAAGEADEIACKEALALADVLGLEGSVHYADGHPAGFVLVEALRDDIHVVRFAKALAAFNGTSQLMFQHWCRTRPAVGWLNFEQDLGLENFRRTKMSYEPSALVLKYRVKLR